MSKGNMRTAIETLYKIHDVQFPIVTRQREWFAFNNGIVCVGSREAEDRRAKKAEELAQKITRDRLFEAERALGGPDKLTQEDRAMCHITREEVEGFYLEYL